ncbi:MAG: vesicle formation at the endoplasmic reticulum [Sclerophora amabilis]|nr:MAG: vesicle formation at the endoplasmic reticulum [Sclerophora amabilis]
MMQFITAILCLSFVAGSLPGARAVPPTSSSDVFERLGVIPPGWTQLHEPSPDLRLALRIAIKSENLPRFEQTLLDVSTPGHERYGKFLEWEEMKAQLRPTTLASESILGWLDTSGIPKDDIEDDGDWVSFNVSISQAERMLDTKFHWYRNSINKAERIRTLQYSIPNNLHRFVDMIQPTIRFGQIRPDRSLVIDKEIKGVATGEKNIYGSPSNFNLTACNATITPTGLKELYKVDDFKASASSGKGFGICGYLEEYARYNDLATFLKEYAPSATDGTFSVQSVRGGLNTQNDTVSDSVEANLDIQYGVSLAYPVPVTYYSTAGRGPLVPDSDQPMLPGSNEPYLDFLTYILKLPNSELPHTLSTSYGEDEQSVPESYNRKVCSMFAQLGSRGVSVLFSSGDTGPGSACQSNDGKNTTRFNPIFPAACPYLTSVGGTQHVKPERAVAFSSGGFSDRFPRPQYQDAAVKNYLDQIGTTFSELFNREGRGFPDVAAQGSRFHVVDKGREITVGGTSASAPTFASIVALLNSARLDAKQPPLGFLNPWIYSTGKDGLTDIVDGGSTGCTGTDIFSGLPSSFVPGAGWNATKGWDPVTGYGTPDFGKLLKLSSSAARY